MSNKLIQDTITIEKKLTELKQYIEKDEIYTIRNDKIHKLYQLSDISTFEFRFYTTDGDVISTNKLYTFNKAQEILKQEREQKKQKAIEETTKKINKLKQELKELKKGEETND